MQSLRQVEAQHEAAAPAGRHVDVLRQQPHRVAELRRARPACALSWLTSSAASSTVPSLASRPAPRSRATPVSRRWRTPRPCRWLAWLKLGTCAAAGTTAMRPPHRARARVLAAETFERAARPSAAGRATADVRAAVFRSTLSSTSVVARRRSDVGLLELRTVIAVAAGRSRGRGRATTCSAPDSPREAARTPRGSLGSASRAGTWLYSICCLRTLPSASSDRLVESQRARAPAEAVAALPKQEVPPYRRKPQQAPVGPLLGASGSVSGPDSASASGSASPVRVPVRGSVASLALRRADRAGPRLGRVGAEAAFGLDPPSAWCSPSMHACSSASRSASPTGPARVASIFSSRLSSHSKCVDPGAEGGEARGSSLARSCRRGR